MDNSSRDAIWHRGVTVPVAWGDMDAFRHVNNTVYLRWFETARIAFFQDLSLDKPVAASIVGPILASISVNFRRPVIFPDTIHTTARIKSVGRTSLVMEHRVTSTSTNGALVADGEGVVVMVNYQTGKPVPVPDDMRRLLES